MSNNKNNIIAIVILSAVILLLCILCVTLVYDGKKEKTVNNTSTTYSTTELVTEKRTTPTTPTPSSDEHTTKATAPTINLTQPTPQQTTTDIEITIPVTEATTENINEPYTERTPTEAETETPEDILIQLIKGSGYSLRDIEQQGIEQLIVITAGSLEANAYMFTFSDDKWNDENITCKAYVGSAGIGEKETDTDNITPKGLYMLGDAFYTKAQPSTWLNTFVITEHTYWITDSDSEMYNKKVECKQDIDFKNAIHMINEDIYRYGCVINYNINPIIKGKGSAIFMHCGTEETNGSVALAESDLLKFLEILNSEKNPAILIF